jgi:hypothetical protein
MTDPQTPQPQADWWVALSQHLGVDDKAQRFFQNSQANHVLEHIAEVNGDIHYLLFVLLRNWIPTVLPPSGKERLSKNDPDYWLESSEILQAAVDRLRELKPLIDLLTTPNPFEQESPQPSPVVEVELATMLEGIAQVTGSYGGPDFTSIIKNFHPIPLRQTQPFKHNKKHSAELWMVFLLREHLRSLGMGKDRYWPLIADVVSAAGIYQPNDQPYSAGELKSWWTKNWPRTFTTLNEKAEGTHGIHTAYQNDYQWFQTWFAWQLSVSEKA